jgi:DNA modification methylase
MILAEKANFDFNGDDRGYLTHSLHPYPAKFPPQLPQKLLTLYAKQGETILDPFCGSGTTLIEAKLQGINSIGVDVNGLACLLSKVKATVFQHTDYQRVIFFIEKIKSIILDIELGNVLTIKSKEIEGLNHWFQYNVSQEITTILNEIDKLENQAVKDFLKIVLSSIIVRVSNQESDTRFAAIDKKIVNSFTLNLFVNKTKEYLTRVMEFSEKIKIQTTTKIFNADSRKLDFIEPTSIDLIITSPPYANTYDYYLYHKFRKRWLDLDVKFAQYNEIGSRREFSSLKKAPEKWNKDLILCFLEMNRVLKPNGLAFIVIGDSVIKKNLIKIDEVIRGFSKEIGFDILDIVSSDLAKHSRLFNPSFAQKGKQEHLITLKKI